ncbi:type 2 periplasmic-binding domain-containing protein [Bordetella hinzii]|uniref:hypothetical protein n=1 Tax=Bordetella hinzii TaxID=103855 RepID=UPI002B4864A3|nr:hypothetical protein [Bordetella hinzii]
MTQGDGTRAAVDAAFEPDRRKLILDTPYAATICRMVAMGLGVSVINPLVMRHLKIPGVVSLPLAASIVPLPRQFPPASRGGGPAPRWSPPA